MTDVTIGDLGKETEAQILHWHVVEGDRVTAGQSLADVETKKTVIELPAPEDGVITKLHRAVGDTVVPGDVVATIASSKAESASSVQCVVCRSTALSTDTFCPSCESFLKVSPTPDCQDLINAAYSIDGSCYVVVRIKETKLVSGSGNAPQEVFAKKLKDNPEITCRGIKLNYMWDCSKASQEDGIMRISANPGTAFTGGLYISDRNLLRGAITFGINPTTKKLEVSIDGDFGFRLSYGNRKNADTLAMLTSNRVLFPDVVDLEKELSPIKAKVNGKMVELWLGFTETPYTNRRHEPGTAPAVTYEIVSVSVDKPSNAPTSYPLPEISR